MNITGIKTGGRALGTPNKTTRELRETLKELFTNEIVNFRELLEQLEPNERASIIIKLLPYIIPRAVEIQEPQQEPKGFTVKIINSRDELEEMYSETIEEYTNERKKLGYNN